MKKTLFVDCEVYPNYFLCAFLNLETQKLVTIDTKTTLSLEDRKKLNSAMSACTTIGFNSNNYDLPVITMAINGATTEEIYKLSGNIIENRMPGWLVAKNNDLAFSHFDHVDIIEPAPGVKVSLKLYGARLHSKKLQDLPYDPHTILEDNEIEELKAYCINDLLVTQDLYLAIKDEIDLRIKIGEQYKQDFRSKSGGQMATAMLLADLKKLDVVPPKVNLSPTYTCQFKMPPWVTFKSDVLKAVQKTIEAQVFELDGKGSVKLPQAIAKEIKIGAGKYKMGIGGLHSNEKNQTIKVNDDTLLLDRDVASMYPATIINQGLYPKTVGPKFLSLYRSMRDRRIVAKKAGDMVTSDSLKLSLNSMFGLTGSKYSKFYDPQTMLQITLSGQLALLMLIERLELLGITVVSANTDGFVSIVPKDMYDAYDSKCKQWEQLTGYELEETPYSAMYSRDVNNYIAVTTDGKVKTKGCFSAPGLRKNVTTPIVYEAVTAALVKGIPVKDTITTCKDLTKFLSSQRVTGGAVWQGDYLGKVVRWYYSVNGQSIHYKTNGNKVAKSDGAKPIMDLVDTLPIDVDLSWYISEANDILSKF